MIETKSTNPVLKDLLKDLEEKARKENAEIWRKTASYLKKGNKRASVNLSEIDRNSRKGETVLIPGKVLGTGELTKNVKVVAFKFSDKAREEIEKKGETLRIKELLEENPEGSGVKILG